ncbi:cobalamin biosynthesis protein, partial [Streptomyces sp. W16]|uniref:cobalt-precorrin 5A hydrolase n=1 Tax=Streptomyces sp. W16 TaxID=3076631 RepID=UPI00295B4F6F
MIGLISATAAGAGARDRLAAAWPDRTRVYEGPVGDAVRAAFAECEQLVCFLATGAVVRLIAPLLGDKRTDPGVVCVDEGGRFAVSLVGGHGGGANELAGEVGELLAAQPVVTTATDAVGVPGLDTLGFPVEGDVAGVSRALLDGEPVSLDAELAWPLPPLKVSDHGAYVIRVTDRAVEPAEREVVLRPPSLVIGIGASRSAPVNEVLALVSDALREAGLSVGNIAELATVDAKAEEPGIVQAAQRLGVPLVTYSAGELAAVEVPNPSDAPLAAVGTPSVAEAAALVGGGQLLVPKRKSERADGQPAMARPAGPSLP